MRVWRAVLVATEGSELHDSLYTNIQGFELLADDVVRHSPSQFLHQYRTQRSSGSEMWKLTPSFPSKHRRKVAASLNLLTVDGTTIKLLLCSWADRSLGQDALNQARKARVSLATEIKLGVLLGRCSACKLLVIGAGGVVLSGLSLRGPDKSLDMV